MTRLLPLALSGCLLFSEPPPGADPTPDCVDSMCPGGLTCDTVLDACATGCDATQPCQDGYACELGQCVELCEDSECPFNLACDPFENACFDSCETNDECAGSYVCCTETKRDNGRCDFVGECF